MKDTAKTKKVLIAELETLRQRCEDIARENASELRAAKEKLNAEIAIRNQIERELRDREERYRSIFDNSIDGILFSAPDGAIFEANRAACKMLGMSEQELCEGGRAAVTDESDSRWLRMLEERARTGHFFGEVNLKRKDDSVFPAEISTPLFLAADGSPRSTVIIRDITRRKQIETELRDSEEKYRRMFENKLVAICIIDIETLAFLDVNDTHVRIYGYSREELINRITLFDLTTEPDVLRKSFQQIKTSGTAHIALRYHRKKDGTLFPVELVGSIHYLKDRPVAFVIARDITERIRAEEALRASEQRLALALKATQDALWDLDLTTNTLYCSSLWWEMIGYGENEIEFDRELWFRLMHPDDMEEARRIVRKAVAEHDSFELEARLLHKDGHYVHTLTKGFILRDKDGKAVRLSGINTDLTNRKRAEEERRQWEWQKQQLEKAESLSRMAAAIAHKFNNMLGVVIGNLDLAMAGLSPKTEPYETVAEAMKASRRAAAVSGQMLTYLGKAIVKYESLDLAQTCRSALPMLRTVLGNSILFEADIPAAGPYIKGNAIQIQEILKVLTTNASEAIGENEGIIHFALRAVPSAEIPTVNRFPINWSPQETAYACIEVGDTGGGIKDENIAQIFDPFFSTKFPGRGLGLAIALGIVRAHRGGITVKNTPGQGCVFRIFFPLSGFERKLETEIHS